MYLNKSIFALIDKEVNKKYENKNIEEIVQREIAKALKDIQIPKERKRENNENTKIDENIQSNLQKKVLSQLDL
jgi:hypothetical protein